MLLCLTANHRNASFDLLERLSVGAEQAASSLVARSDFVSGAVVLATCNRFEAYLEIDEPLTAAKAVAVEATIQVMSESSGVDSDALRRSVSVLAGSEVANYLFAVSSGLESVVVGEDEISGQVRRALERARDGGTTSPALERLFQRATQTSRAVKARTPIAGAGRSLVRLALQLSSSRIADWSAARVLIVGTGQYAATTVTALRGLGAVELSVFSPSGRAVPFATKYGLRATTDLPAAIAEADVVITCTANLAITPDDVPLDLADRARKLLVIDLGLPRNVDPAVARAAGLELLDLETISLHAPLDELNAASDARAYVGSAAAAFSAEAAVEPAIVAFRSHIFEVLDAEIARAHARGASPETEAALRHLAGVLLHGPSVRARELAIEGRGEEFVAGLEAVYGIRTALGERSRLTDAQGAASA